MANVTDLEQHLALHFVHVVEQAAVASARTMGQGDRKGSDQAAVQAMRQAFEHVPIAGSIVIGEGERDEAPMLYIGEKVGAPHEDGRAHSEVDIAVDPLKARTCAQPAPTTRSRFWRWQNPEGFCTPRIATWRRSSRGLPAGERLTWMRLSRRISSRSQGG